MSSQASRATARTASAGSEDSGLDAILVELEEEFADLDSALDGGDRSVADAVSQIIEGLECLVADAESLVALVSGEDR